MKPNQEFTVVEINQTGWSMWILGEKKLEKLAILGLIVDNFECQDQKSEFYAHRMIWRMSRHITQKVIQFHNDLHSTCLYDRDLCSEKTTSQ